MRPLVFIIDELDRCKPLFALEIIERIKHFFSVDGINFVFGVNLDQLYVSVRSAYGSDIDAQLYLQKFLSFTYSLVDNYEYEQQSNITKYTEYLSVVMAPDGPGNEAWRYFVDYIKPSSHKLTLNFRTIEKVFSVMALSLAYSTKGELNPAPIIGGLAVMKVVYPELFIKAKAGRLTYKEASDALLLDAVRSDGQLISEFSSYWWQFCLVPAISEEINNRLRSVLFNYSISRERIVPVLATRIVDRMAPSN